jgi:A/G-specific adenine glycosylase
MALSGTELNSKAQASRNAEEKIRRKLQRWFCHNGRDLPWRHTRDPYAVMVSEFMLQQTTVAAVIPYFRRWMERFPTLETLALAREEDVLTLWQGLGYYGRARSLRRAAQVIVEEAGRKVPTSAEALRRLPGVGRYTAAAIASFAFDAPEPVIDANIARVLSRLRNWRKPLNDAVGRTFLAAAANKLFPKQNGRLHNSALMDLGALVCVARNPKCHHCPVRDDCLAKDPQHLPFKQPRKAERICEARAFIFEQGRLWLELSAGPRWQGLWILPAAEARSSRPAHVELFSITRFRVKMGVYLEDRKTRQLTGYPPGALPPMPSPHRRAVAAMLAKVHSRR